MKTKTEEIKKGRTYKMEFIALKEQVNWDLMANQLFKLAEEVEKACSIPVNIKMTDHNSSLSEQYIRRGRVLEDNLNL